MIRKWIWKHRFVIFAFTPISFLLILGFLVVFAYFISGKYQTGSFIDIIFATILLINEICIILSLWLFVDNIIYIAHEKKCGLGQVVNCLLGIYPMILCGFFICSANPQMFVNYFLSPFRLLYEYIIHYAIN